MKIVISRKMLIISFAILFGIVLLGLLYKFIPKPITSYNFYGTEFHFRADLRDANKILVEPNNQAIHEIVWSHNITNISIAYVDSEDNEYVAVQAFEVTYKLMRAYGKFNIRKNISAIEVNSYDNLKGTEETLIIALVPPVFSNETIVRVEDNVVYIKAKSYKEFDLATIKFLMSALNITL